MKIQQRKGKVFVRNVHPILKSFIPVAEAIAQMMGSNCEVAIQDLSHPKHSILFIANGHLTGRKVGDSLGLFLDEVVEIAQKNEDRIVGYNANINGHSFKSTKVLIKDANGKIIGIFCINLVLDSYLQAQELLTKICETTELEQFSKSEDYDFSEDNISDFIKDIITNTYNDMTAVNKKLNKERKVEMVRFLEEKGIFKVKGSVEMVADHLRVTKFPVYNYLDEIRTTKED